jgi:predicted AlkP superfamily phosphohydrolase/phosphomutase
VNPRTLLLGLDGATFAVLDPLMARGVMPFLRDFVGAGARAPLRSVVPCLTPPAWTSLMTGKHPGRHGVFDFFQKESADGLHLRLSTSRDIGSETVWTLASAAGRRVNVLNFPQTFPPPRVDGCVVPGGWMPWRQFRLGCHPAGLFDRLKALPSFEPRELAMDMAMEEKALEGCAAEEYADWIRMHIRRERRWLEVASFLMAEEPADLTAVMFDGVDKIQHLCWRFLDPDAGPPADAWDREVSALCEEYFRQLDAILAHLVGLAGPDSSVVIASDHGFGLSRDIFFVNTWLQQQGYLAWSSGADAARDSQKVGIGHMARHVHELDWSRTVAYASTPSSQGIHLARRGPDGRPIVPPGACGALRDEIAEGLRALRHPQTGEPLVDRVWTRDEAFAGPFGEIGPDLTFYLAGNGVASILRSEAAVVRRPRAVGSHHPLGVFAARSPSIRAGATLPELSIVDVAPLLLYAADVPIPDDLDGRLPAPALVPDALTRRPARSMAASPAAAPIATEPAELGFDADEHALVLRRLAALGYLE